MSGSKHTPGPWTVGRKYIVGPVDDGDSQLYGMVIGVADVYGDNREADARLIASAPELLEALKMVLQHGRIDNSEERMNVVSAAVAKAEGRS